MIFNPWDWACRALIRYSKLLGRKPRIDKENELTIVLIGKTQEGKTTLALRLLGANDDEAERLEPRLRGGREYGQSATPIACVYKAISGELNDVFFRDIESKLKKARNNRPANEDLIIQVPLKGTYARKVVDLVGLEPRDNKESLYAVDESQRWLHEADLLIYVCGGDHIADLLPHDHNMARIMRRWEINPESSVIAITMAFETDTSKKYFEAIADPNDMFASVQNYYQGVIKNELDKRDKEKKVSSDQLPLILPLCLKSHVKKKERIWKMATVKALETIKNAIDDDPVRFKVRAELTYPIQLSNELERDMEELEAKRIAFLDIEYRYNQTMNELLKQKNDLESSINIIKKSIGDSEKNKNSFIPNIEEACRSLRNNSSRLQIRVPEQESGKKVELLRDSARTFICDIMKRISDFRMSLDRLFYQSGPVRRQHINAAVDYMYYTVNSALNIQLSRVNKDDVIVTGGFIGYMVKWDKSVDQLKGWAKDIRQIVLQQLSECCVTYIDPTKMQYVLELDGEIEKYKFVLDKEQDNFHVCECRINAEKKDFKKHKKEYEKEKDDLDRNIKEKELALQKCQQYRRFLAEEFISAWNREVDFINKVEGFISVINSLGNLWIMEEKFNDIVQFAEGKMTS